MSRLSALPARLVIMTLALAVTAPAATRQIRLHKIDRGAVGERTEIRIRPAIDTTQSRCVLPLDTAVWRVDGWVTGSELYKSYLDPSQTCEDPYPFLVTEISMPLYVAESTVIIVSVDVEDVYHATDDCPFPDSILAISADYMVPIPGEGYYDIWVPLDEPLTVDGPFFAGFFIGNLVDSAAGVAILANDVETATCLSYDIWDEQIGFVDLVNNGVLDFPGRLLLYVSGVPGGATERPEPEPRISILCPEKNQILHGSTTIWAHEYSGSNIIECVVFEYAVDAQFVECGRDYDGASPIRNGSASSGRGNGFCQTWDFSHLTEGICTLRVTAVDTLGRTASDTVTVYLEPSPPTPKIVSPANGSMFCGDVDILVTCPDENLGRVEFYTQVADDDYSAGILPLIRTDTCHYPDAAGAAAMALHLWMSRGVEFPLYGSQSEPPAARIAADLAALFEAGPRSGATDEEVYCALKLFSSINGLALDITTGNYPDYSTIRTLVQEQRQTVLLGLGGPRGTWLTLDGFEGWQRSDETYRVIAVHPSADAKQTYSVRRSPSGLDIYAEDNWLSIDRYIAVRPTDWNIDRRLVGTDTTGSDGWSLYWETSGLESGARCFVRVETVDEDGFTAQHSVLLNHDCSQFYTVGDYDGNASADIVDLAYLIEFVIRKGPEPIGGRWRADANGDRHVNVTDVVYYMNYLYGLADKPCH